METNNLFQNQARQQMPTNNNYMNWNGQNNNYMQGYGGATTQTIGYRGAQQTIPVRVVFSPEQIAPQEIPTNGTPALFPMSDGSCIIAKSLLPNGMFDERVYTLAPRNGNAQNQPSEFDQVMNRLGSIENSLKAVINDLYGAPKMQQPTQEGMVSQNE